jgi:hypothetical protein
MVGVVRGSGLHAAGPVANACARAAVLARHMHVRGPVLLGARGREVKGVVWCSGWVGVVVCVWSVARQGARARSGTTLRARGRNENPHARGGGSSSPWRGRVSWVGGWVSCVRVVCVGVRCTRRAAHSHATRGVCCAAHARTRGGRAPGAARGRGGHTCGRTRRAGAPPRTVGERVGVRARFVWGAVSGAAMLGHICMWRPPPRVNTRL